MLELPSSPILDVITKLRPEYIGESHLWSRVLSQSLARHSFWTYEHSLRVGYVTGRLAEEFTKKGEEHVLLQVRAGKFHDIGKLAVPETILDTGDLEPWQRNLLDKHPRIGFLMLSVLDKEAAQIMVTHHEYQTRSYPRKVRRVSDNLWQEDREFLALADGVDALLSERPYKLAWGVEQVVSELKNHFREEHIRAAIQMQLELKSTI